jgi:hypothetical protein
MLHVRLDLITADPLTLGGCITYTSARSARRPRAGRAAWGYRCWLARRPVAPSLNRSWRRVMRWRRASLAGPRFGHL